jgi:Uma2 family endonuclease
MRTALTERIWTDDELLALHSGDGRKHELWYGKIVTMPPAGGEHGDVTVRLASALATFVYDHKLGRVYDGQTGFRLSLDFCFAPDLSYVSKERIKIILPIKEKLFHGAPDIAVEVLSPSDSITKTEEKIKLYLTHGTRLAWMLDLRNECVRVYREPGKFELLRPGRFLSGNAVVPGFRYAVAKLFEDPNFD